MKILIAEDDPVSRKVLVTILEKRGYEVLSVQDGESAWEILKRYDAPQLVILDWMMPGKDGTEVCRLTRASAKDKYVYIILLTGKGRKIDVIEGLDAGADDYVTKPFNAGELIARVKVGERVVGLQNRLNEHVEKLQDALDNVETLQGLLPICSYCHKIRDDKNYWMSVETYISEHSEAKFSHSICPDCMAKYVKPEIEKLDNGK
ncbi:response regulator [bacterium]|nr:response regulator [bacterium]